MKFQCDKCSTVYAVPDEKVRGKRLRIKCKRCGAPVILEGPPNDGPSASVRVPSRADGASPEGPAGSRPLAGQRTQVGGLQAPGPLRGSPIRPLHATQIGIGDALPRPPPVPKLGAAERWTVAISRDDPRKMTTEEVVQAFQKKMIGPKTLIWKKGMEQWQTPFDIPLIALALKSAGVSPPGTPGFNDEDEATRLHNPGAQGPLSGPSSPGAAAGALPKPVAPPPDPDAFSDDETTTVLEPDRARQLLSDGAMHPSERPPDSSDDEEITHVLDPGDAHRLLAPLTGGAESEKPEGGDEEEGTDGRHVTAAAAEGLRGTSASAEPSVVVSENSARGGAGKADAERPDAAKPAPMAVANHRVNPVHVAIQNEPTRIVRVQRKQKRLGLLVGIIVIVTSSAAGGFFAARFLTPAPPATRR